MSIQKWEALRPTNKEGVGRVGSLVTCCFVPVGERTTYLVTCESELSLSLSLCCLISFSHTVIQSFSHSAIQPSSHPAIHHQFLQDFFFKDGGRWTVDGGGWTPLFITFFYLFYSFGFIFGVKPPSQFPTLFFRLFFNHGNIGHPLLLLSAPIFH